MAEMEYEFFDKLPKWGIFHTCVVYVDVWEEVSNPTTPVISGELEIISLDLRMYGAEVVQVVDQTVTHVVCAPVKSDRISCWKSENRNRDKKLHLVTKDWVTCSIANGRPAEEQPFYPS